MKNLKKVLALVLVVATLMGFATVSSAAFTDAADIENVEAVEVLSALGVINGYSDGSFKADGNVTRAQMAKMVAFIMNGGEDVSDLYAAANIFTDCTSHWAKGYIAYASNVELVAGVGAGKFNPDGSVTGVQAAKMLLCALGYDATIETYTGTTWAANVIDDAKKAGLFEGFAKGFDYNAALTRDYAALMMFNALNASTVGYETKGTNITINGVVIASGASSASTEDGDGLLREVMFGEDCDIVLSLTEGTAQAPVTDALGRPAHKWSVEDPEWEGTYADEPALIFENAVDADDVAEALEDAEIEADVTTANGKTVEVFEDGTVVEIEAVLATVTDIADDKVSTADEDERAIEIEGDAVVADADVVEGVELANFEDLYENLEEEDAVLVVYDVEGAIYSVEIPEIVEAKITKVKGDEIVAGGETYLLQADVDASVTSDEVELTVGANGVVYAIAGITSELSEVIYLDTVFEVEYDKWDNPTWNAQIINEDYEIVEIALAASVADDEETEDVDESVNVGLEKGFYTYEINDDDEYVLTAVEAVVADSAIEDDDTYTKIDSVKTYFADDMVVVYITESGADLAVTVKEGAQNVTAAHIVLNDDDDAAIIYVYGEFEDGESEDVIYLADADADASVLDNEGKAASEYVAYVDGKEVEVKIANADEGFWTYTIDEASGVYTLENEKGYNDVSITITKDKYVSYSDIDDATVSGDIYDLTDEGLTTLKKIAAWDGDAVVVSFLYDEDANEITQMYVDFAPAAK